MNEYSVSLKQVRQFMLLKQGLAGEYRFIGKDGVLEFVNQASCIQFDPIDVCGKNAELVLQSRIKGFKKEMLYDLLYKDRKLIDYYDKNMAILPVEDWPYFSYIRQRFIEDVRSSDKIDAMSEEVKKIIKEKKFASSKDINLQEKIDWYWAPTTMGRAVLEAMYFRGDLIIHHKKGTIKYYSLAEDYLPSSIYNQLNPLSTVESFKKWRLKRRIGAIGLLWNKPSDAWMFISLTAEERKQYFKEYCENNQLFKVKVVDDDIELFGLIEDEPLLKQVLNEEVKIGNRVEFLAPLDSMLWDRKLIKKVFNFEYTWEIYTPEVKRKYGYYVLPMLYRDNLVGRIEVVNDKVTKVLKVKNIFFEDGFKVNATFNKELDKCLNRFAKFNNATSYIYEVK
jgi:hypothetical protein